MGLSQSLFSGISGLNTHQQAMDNIGNNLANVNTTAFKKGVFQFRTLLEQTLRGGSMADPNTGRGSINPLQIGLGTQTGSIMKDFSDGSVEITGNQRDMALEGNGFFVLRNGNSNIYTRDGSFYLGSDGSLLYGSGLYVQGVAADEGGIIPEAGEVTDIKIPIGQTGGAVETTKASFTGNLNSNSEVAEGLRLSASSSTINSNVALKEYLGEVRDANTASGTDDDTWNALEGNAYINGGTVWTSSSFGVMNESTGAIEPAVLTGDGATPLEDLWYLSGSTWTQPFKNIDNPARFTMVGDSASSLTNWQFEGEGYKLADNFYYHLESDGSSPEGFVLEVYDVPYSDVVALATSGSATEAYGHLMATSADGATAGSVAPWSLYNASMGAAGASSLTSGSYFTPEGSDVVSLTTTDSGSTWAQAHDATMTTVTARDSFAGSLRFGNDLTAGNGRMDSYTPSNVEQDVTISYRKGGRKYETTFTYDSTNGTQSSTIEHLMKFLCGNVDSTINAGSIEAIQDPLETPPIGGAMGTIQVAGRVSSTIDGGEYGYNVPPETAGAFTREGITDTVPYAGYFDPSGDDSSSLQNWTMTEPGWSIKNKWYYEVEAIADPAIPGAYQYAVSTYSDSARTNPVSTTAKMLGTGDSEMRRSLDLSGVAALTDSTYAYRVDDAGGGNYTLNVIDRDTSATVWSATGSAGTTGIAVAGGTVNFGVDMEIGSAGYIYMNNMGQGANLSSGSETLGMTTTVQGIQYAQNNGIGSYTALSAFDGDVEMGAYFSATDVNPSYGSLNTSGPSQNYSIVSNLGSENAITDIVIGYNNVSFTDMWSQDAKYSEEQGGSTTTNVVVYDSLGNPKEITMTISLVERDSDFSTYRWIAESLDDSDAAWQVDDASKEITSNVNVGTGTIRFDSSGNFVRGVELSETQGIELTLRNQGVSDQLLINMTEGLSPDARQDLDFSYLTQVAAVSDFNLRDQDGAAPGTLDSFTTSADGIIQGVYSNGVVQAIARISVALIPNTNGLMAAGDNLYYTAPASGGAQISYAGVGGRGSIRAQALESSNVNMSEEFTKMITTQRGFQANARVISTSDEMLTELVNLKR